MIANVATESAKARKPKGEAKPGESPDNLYQEDNDSNRKT
jgi:hypothetical protein